MEYGTTTAERLRLLLAECMSEKSALLDENRRLNRADARRERYERELLKRLYLDEKTGFPNHAYLSRECEYAFSRERAAEDGYRSAIIFIALDETFEVLKKSQASIVSEWVLYKIAHWIREIVGDSGKVYHTRSTEFAVLLHRIDAPQECATLVERISRRMSEIHRFPGHHITVGCRIGCAMFPEHATSPGDMLRCADIALSECAKTKDPWAIFRPEMEQRMMERIQLKNGLLRALEQQAIDEISGQFELYYQPLVKVASVNGNGMRKRTVGAECLIRWNHPEQGLIRPDKFIPIAEESGLIIPIGNWIFYQAARQIQHFRELAQDPIYLSLNLSPKQFYDPYLVESIERVLTNRDIDPESIQVEITETSVMDDPDDAKIKLEAIRDMGIKLSIDDFGTGYSSLSYLKNLEIDCLKIDKSFIDDVVTNTQNQGIVRAVISMARSLGMDILAEGVESLDQLEFVHSEGCNQIQGYYFSKPLNAEDFAEYLSHN